MKRKHLILCLFFLAFLDNAMHAAEKTSFQSGEFSVGSTWIGGVAPVNGDDIIIATGHTVTLDANAYVRNISIEVGAHLVNSTYDIIGFSVTPGAIPQYINNGTHDGPGKFVLYDGGRTQLQGSGILNCSVEVVSYGLEMLSSCNLTINGNVQHANPGNNGMNMKAIIEAWEGGGGSLTINGDIITDAEYGGVTIDNHTGTIIVNGNVTLSGSSVGGTGGILRNFTTFHISGNLSLGAYFSYCANFGEMSIGGDLLGASESETFFLQAVNSIVKFGGEVFPDTAPGYLDPLNDENFASAQPNTIEYNGSISQVLEQPASGAYSNLVINNVSNEGVSLNAEITLNGDLYLTHGFLNLGDSDLNLGDTTTIIGSPSTTNMIVGSGSGILKKMFASPGSFLFPLGDNTGIAAYTPVSITLSSGVMTSGYVGVRVVGQSYPGSSGSYLNRYWEITSGGIADYTGDVSLTYSQQDVVGDENIIYCYRVSPTTDLFEPANTVMNQLTANGITSFGTFTGRQQNVPPPLQFTVTGGGEYCSGSEGLPVGLSGSQTGVVYTLYRDGVAQQPTVDGTGEALDFGLQTSGVYTVTGFNNGGTTSMAGQAQIVELASPEVSVVIDVSENDICAGSSVTFTSQVINGGNATYQWYVNDQPVGSDQASYTYTPQSGDNVYVEVHSDIPCATNNPAVSNSIMMVVNEYPVAVSITADNNPNCSGTAVTFTAVVSNGGNTAYQWYVNSVAVGDNQATYSYVAEDGDQIYVVVTSDLPCATNNPATSDTIEMIVNETLSASVSILPDNDTVCSGDSVIVTAYPVNGGSANYQWYKNDIAVGSNQPTYTFVPENMDEVKVVMTSGLSCAVDNPATSNTITLTVNPLITADVGIVADADQVCDGTLLGFLALPNGAGSNPVFQWYVNGQEVGESAPTFSYIPQNNDSVYLLMYSSLTCPSNNPSISNTVHVQVNPLPEVSWPVFDPDTLCNEWEPVELYGAIPAGGVYTGEGVVNGWFDPELAGVGTHEIQYTFVDGNGCTNSTTRELYVDVCQTIPEMNEKVSVYPNPVSESLTVLIGVPTGAYDVSLINVLGERVFHQKRLKQERINIPMQGFRNGVYVLRIKSPHKIICETIIKQ